MLVEQTLGNLSDDPSIKPERIDWLDLTWLQCAARALRLRTRGRREVRILLRLGIALHHGDVLSREADSMIAVNVLPCDVLVAAPRDTTQSAALAFELGNLHASMELTETGQIITPADGPVEAIFQKLDVAYSTEMRRFDPTHRGTPEFTTSADFKLTRPM
jgi:urease accessory protein